MSSIIEGYSYDVFISYRQKDNKHEGWVSEFVNNLKGELEATFKEDISVYFDINPHDGLLETYEVEESLREKLKCLIFIPILSRTYCDPKSFAWEHEFKAFVETSSRDQFGLKVKLPNGNIGARVLPIRIHDLDSEDIKLCESLLGGVLRGVEFVYKSAGVNRPLRATEEKSHENLNRTIYRDQINKVSLAIRELIVALKAGSVASVVENVQTTEIAGEGSKTKKKAAQIELVNPRKKWLTGSSVAAIVILAAVICFLKFFRQDRLISSDERITVAVMPFQNISNDSLLDPWKDGIQDNLITSLTNTPGLNVRQPESINSLIQSKGIVNYASITPSFARAISRKLDAKVFVYGTINQSGNKIRLNVQLINTGTKEVFKSFQKDCSEHELMPAIDTLSREIKDFMIMSKLEWEESDMKWTEFSKQQYASYLPTKSAEAYKCLLYARKASSKNEFSAAREWYLKALEIDSTLFAAIKGTALTYYNENKFKEGKEWVLKLYRYLDKMTTGQKLEAKIVYGFYFEGPKENIEYNKQLLAIDDQNPGNHFNLGDWYLQFGQYDKAIIEFEKGLAIYRKWDVKPPLMFYQEPGQAYHMAGRIKEEKKFFRKARKDYPDAPDMLEQYAYIALEEGDTAEANRYINKWISIRKEQSWSDAHITSAMAWIYSMAGNNNKTEECLRKALAMEPKNGGYIANLAYFLIDKDRNLNEGIELADKVLKKNPDAINALHNKGWALYKQGKYMEALELLQKSWDLRMKNSIYNHTAYLHLEEAKKAVAGMK
jgi:tetratricopeptide (TPR) repeat protein/TolB-like protein